jgi:hypothetical protein
MGGATRDKDALVSVLDPDATSMQPGKGLAVEDAVRFSVFVRPPLRLTYVPPDI